MDTSQCYIMSEQRSKCKPHGLSVCTAVQTTQRMRPTERTCSHKCQDANAVAGNSGDVLHNRPDARASHPDAL